MDHTAVSSVTLQIWLHGAKDNYFNFATLNRAVDTKTGIIQMGSNILNVDWKMNLNRS